ncbi:MAG: hypothetical protein U0269_23345 [Polyangiales bacterium]
MRSLTACVLLGALSSLLAARSVRAQTALSNEVETSAFVVAGVAPSILALRTREARVYDAEHVGDLDGDGTRDLRAVIGGRSEVAYFAVLHVRGGYCAAPIVYHRTRQWCAFGPSDEHPMFVRALRVGARTYVAVRTVGRHDSSKTDYVLLSVLGCDRVVERYREELEDDSLEFVERRGRIELRSQRRVVRSLRPDASGERMVHVGAVGRALDVGRRGPRSRFSP